MSALSALDALPCGCLVIAFDASTGGDKGTATLPGGTVGAPGGLA